LGEALSPQNSVVQGRSAGDDVWLFCHGCLVMGTIWFSILRIYVLAHGILFLFWFPILLSAVLVLLRVGIWRVHVAGCILLCWSLPDG